jgi:hypothetical protein
MKTAIASLFGIFILLISFQNCQQPPHPDELSGASTLASNTVSATKVDLNAEAVDSVQFMMEDTKVVSRAGNNYQVKYNKTLEINLQTGGMTETSDVDSAVNTYCLSETMKNELVSILKSSQVCRSENKLAAGRVCAQSVKLPYASVTTSSGSYDLGWASDACGSNTIDLCDDQANTLKGFIAAVKSNYTQMACSQ